MMVDFLMYMLFSGLEYLAIFFLVFGVFNMDFRFYKMEIAVGVLATTFVSYVLVKISMHNIIPLPLFLIPLMIFLLVKHFKEKLVKATTVSIGGFIIFGLIQYTTANLLLKMNVLDSSDLINAFSPLTYKVQVLCATISIAISMFLKLTNGGFGFMLLSRVSGVRGFVTINIVLVLICGIVCTSFYVFETASLLLSGLVAVCISVTVICYISYKRDVAEYH